MDQQKYRVVFNSKGILQTKLDIIKQNIATLFKLDIEKIAHLFTGGPVILKKNLNRVAAERYQTAILKTGAQCFIEPEGDINTNQARLQTKTMNCPRCNTVQEETDKCAHCGTDIKAYLNGLKAKGKSFTKEAGIIDDGRSYIRRDSPDRRQAIRFEEDRRGVGDRRAENHAWTGKL